MLSSMVCSVCYARNPIGEMPTVFAYTIDIIFIQFKKKDLLRYFLSIAVSSRSVRAYKICIGRAAGGREGEEIGEGTHTDRLC